MQIKINLKVFLFLIVFIITKQIKIYAILMLFALIHEFGHLIMGLILGFKPESISIIPTGFSLKFKADCKNYNTRIKKSNLLSVKKIAIAIAGPLVNIVITAGAIIYYNITQNTYILKMPIDLIIYANLLICIFNLIPIFPLDGGRILRETIHIYKGLYISYILINKISNIVIILLTAVASVAMLAYKNIAILVIIVYLWILVIKENKNFNIKMKIWKELQ